MVAGSSEEVVKEVPNLAEDVSAVDCIEIGIRQHIDFHVRNFVLHCIILSVREGHPLNPWSKDYPITFLGTVLHVTRD